jgi:hypothetical protein
VRIASPLDIIKIPFFATAHPRKNKGMEEAGVKRSVKAQAEPCLSPPPGLTFMCLARNIEPYIPACPFWE